MRERSGAAGIATCTAKTWQCFNRNLPKGKLNLREVEKARLEENEKWMAYLDANFQEAAGATGIAETAGELDKVWQ